MDSFLNFLSENWPYLLIVLLVIVIIFAIRGVRRFMREGGGAFNIETIRKNSEPNFAALKQRSKALLADAEIVYEMKEGQKYVLFPKDDMKFFRRAVSQKYKIAMFMIPGTNKIVYFFCKTDSGMRRRIENLVPNNKFREGKKPYMDIATGDKLRYPRA